MTPGNSSLIMLSPYLKNLKRTPSKAREAGERIQNLSLKYSHQAFWCGNCNRACSASVVSTMKVPAVGVDHHILDLRSQSPVIIRIKMIYNGLFLGRHYLPTPPLGQDMTQGQFLSGV